MQQLYAKRNVHDEIRKDFKLFDHDDTGKITLQNIKGLCAELGENMTNEEI